MIKQKNSLFIPVAVILLAIVAGLAIKLYNDVNGDNHKKMQEDLAALKFYYLDKPRNLSSVELTSLQGDRKNFTDHMAGWRLVNFGYLFCPDICPINLATLSSMKKEWDGQNLPAFDVLHITFDPERDTPKLLGQYLNHVNPDFYGLTGEVDNIRKVAQQLNMVFIHEKPDERGHYFITHSDSIALLNPQGQYVGMFKGPYNSDNMIKVLRRLIADS